MRQDEQSAVSAPERPRWRMVWAGALVTLVAVGFARLAFGVVLPEMRRDLHLSYAQAGTLGTLTALGYLLLLLPAGLVARRFSSRVSVLGGLLLVTLGFLGLWRVDASGPLGLLPLRGLMLLLGVGTAFVYTPLISLLTAWFPRQRGTVIGLATSGVGLGLFGVGLLVPALSRALGGASWRAVWLLFAACGVLALLAAFLLLRDAPAVQHPPLPERQLERGAGRVYRHRGVLAVGAAYGLGGLSYSVQSLFMVSFMLASGVSSAVAGTLVAVNGLLSVASGLGWGWLSDRLGRGPALALSSALVLLGTLLPVAWPTLPLFTLHWLLLGACMTGVFTLMQASGSEQVPLPDAPLALSTITVFFAAGQFLGPALAGLLLDRAGEVGRETGTGAFRLVFALTAGALLLALLISLRLWRGRAAAPTPS